MKLKLRTVSEVHRRIKRFKVTSRPQTSGCRKEDWIRSGSGLDQVWIGCGSGLDQVWIRTGSGLDQDWTTLGAWEGFTAV